MVKLDERDIEMIKRSVYPHKVLSRHYNTVVESISEDLQIIRLVGDYRPFVLDNAEYGQVTYFPEDQHGDHDAIVIFDDSMEGDLSNIVAFYGS